MEKVSLPIKTKIAAWWLVVIGSTASIVCIFFAAGVILTQACTAIAIVPIMLFPPSFLTFLFGFFMLRRKKLAWLLGITILFIEVLISIWLSSLNIKAYIIGNFPPHFEYVILPLLFLPPFFLLLLDRKNFWKVAT